MTIRKWLSTNAIRNVGVYEVVTGTIGLGVIIYDMAVVTDMRELNMLSWLLTTFPIVNLAAGVLLLRGANSGIYLSLVVQALQVVQVAMPGFALSLTCGLKARLLILPLFGPELGYEWLTEASFGGSSDVFIAINLIPAALVYSLSQNQKHQSSPVDARAESAA